MEGRTRRSSSLSSLSSFLCIRYVHSPAGSVVGMKRQRQAGRPASCALGSNAKIASSSMPACFRVAVGAGAASLRNALAS